MKTELLAPAGSFECFKQALYNGADAIYLATERFGARAYAKNLTLDELKEALILAHSLNKKIYVTVNTIIKENELEEAKLYLNKLYELGVDGVIVTDFALVNYIINNLNEMEAHISTQSGLKDLEDVRFFEKIGAKRCVLARENSFEEIKYIKENSKMPIEVFGYGALCVSYSGGCLFSSLLSLRSGNRGRCSQNCRRLYQIYKDDKLFQDFGYHLSMRDLNTSSYFPKLKAIGVDSLKIEGRMKSEDYVKTVTSELRHKLDDDSYNPTLDNVFHRNYTKGFIFGEDKSNIVDSSKRTNEGAFIGKILGYENNLAKIKLQRPLSIKDRIRIEAKEDYYFTIDKLFNESKKEIKESSSICYINIYNKQPVGSKIFKMVDSSIDLTITNKYKEKIIIKAYGKVSSPLTITTTIYGKTFTAKSDSLLEESLNRPLDKESLFKQLSKLNDTSFYLGDIEFNLTDNCFMVIKDINETRRKLIDEINNYFQNSRAINNIKALSNDLKIENDEFELVAKCRTDEQYEALKELGINKIYYKNYIPYVDAKYNDIENNYILAGNYGAINHYSDKEITCDYSFNAINSEAIYNLLKCGAKYVTLSLEMDYDLIKETTTSFKNKFGFNAPIEIVAYGKENLMTTKYCPLKKHGECGKCNNHQYYLKDDFAKFPIYHEGCITHIINDKPLNLVDDLDKLLPLTNKIRLDFTIESKDEVIRIVNEFKNALNGKKNQFNKEKDTRGYFKRPIL